MENKEHYGIFYKVFIQILLKLTQNSSIDVLPIYVLMEHKYPESNTEFFSEGVVASVIVGGKLNV